VRICCTGDTYECKNGVKIVSILKNPLNVRGIFCYVFYAATPNIYPTSADSPIAIVPQIAILATAFEILDHPVFADMIHSIIKNNSVDP
jgi:hypothetical protein